MNLNDEKKGWAKEEHEIFGAGQKTGREVVNKERGS